MKKGIFLIAVAGMLLVFSGCNAISLTSSGTPVPKIAQKMEVGSKWQVYQMTVNIDPGKSLPIVLILNDGDKVDGYYIVEKGTRVDCTINSNTEIYQSQPPAAGNTSSDRFSFTATQAQGNTYTITFKNSADPASKQSVSVYMELIYPVTGSIFTPLEAK